MTTTYVPDSGDVVWLSFDPRLGREQAGRRPALILSPASYNRKSSLAILCPITSHQKGYPFEVALPAELAVSGVVLADQIKSLDWKERRAESAGRAPDNLLVEVLARLAPLLGF